MVVVGLDAEDTVERGVRVPKSNQVDNSADHRPLEGDLDLTGRVVVAVDRAALSGSHHRVVVVCARQKADVVDLRDALAKSWIARAAR